MKYIGKALIIAGILVVSGFLIFALGFGIALKNPRGNQNDSVYEEKTYTVNADSINLIRTALSSEKIQFEPGEGDDIEILYRDDVNEPRYQITEQNGTLRISRKVTFHLIQIPDLMDWFNEIQEEDVTITVRVPESYVGAYDLNITSGWLSFSNLTVEEKLNIDVASGGALLNEINCKKDVIVDMASGNLEMQSVETQSDLNVEIASGKASFSDTKVNGDYTIDLSSGDVDINGLEVGGTTRLDTASGHINGEEITTAYCTIDIASGKVSLSAVTLGEGIYAGATSGDITVTLTDRMENYSITSDVTSGNSNLPSHFGNGDKYINVDITSGDVNFFFHD